MQDAVPLALEVQRPHPAEMRAVSRDLWSLRVTIDGTCKDDPETLAMMLSHKLPRKDLAVLHEAIRCGIEKHGKRRGAVKPARYWREHMRKYRKGTVTDLTGSGGAVPMVWETRAAG